MKWTSSRLSLSPETLRSWPLMALLLILLLSFGIRMVPARYNSIMDPDAFFMFRMARDVVEKGYYPVWDNLGWQPGGRPLTLEMPLLPFAVAYTYLFLRFLGMGITLPFWTVIFAAIAGSTTVLPIYFIAKDLRDVKTGLIAALLLATIPEFLNRTMGGVTDKECLAIPLMLVGFAAMVRLLKGGDLYESVLKGLIAGLFMGFVAMTWGGFTYILLLLSAFYLIVILLDIPSILEIPDSTVVGLLALSLSMLVLCTALPNWRLQNPFVLIHALATMGLGGYLILTRIAVAREMIPRRTAIVVFLVIGALVAFFPLYGSTLGIIEFRVAEKFLIMLNPFKSPEIGMHITVQEYAKPTFGDWFSRYGFYPFLAIAGAVFSLHRRRLEDVLMVLWAASGFYAGLSAIRSTMLLTPALCVLAAIAVTEFIAMVSRQRSLEALRKEGSRQARSEIRREITLAKAGGPLAALAIIFFLTPSIFMGLDLVQGRTPVLGVGWNDALQWLNKHTPEDSIVLAWWDYGHWITSVAQRRCVSDGATTNFTTIQNTATAYLSPEDVAVQIYKQYDVAYVVVPDHDFWLAGAFAQIVGNITDFPDGYYKYNTETGSVSWTDLTPKGRNTTIYKLIFAQQDSAARNFELIHQSPSGTAYRDTAVKIYKVNYDALND